MSLDPSRAHIAKTRPKATRTTPSNTIQGARGSTRVLRSGPATRGLSRSTVATPSGTRCSARDTKLSCRTTDFVVRDIAAQIIAQTSQAVQTNTTPAPAALATRGRRNGEIMQPLQFPPAARHRIESDAAR